MADGGTEAGSGGRRTLARRLLTWYAVAVIALLGALGVALDLTLQRVLVDELTDSLADQARLVQAALREGDDLQRVVAGLGAGVDARVTIIEVSGRVLADSAEDPARMDDHSDRPEVIAAVGGDVGTATRDSATLGVPLRYVALPVEDDRIVRMALPLTIVDEAIGRIRLVVVVGGVLAALVGVAVVWLLARRLASPLETLMVTARSLSGGGEPAELPGSSTTEIETLAATLNDMADQLTVQIDDLSKERRLRDSILSALDEGVILVDGADGLPYLNPWAAAAYDALPNDLTGLTPHGLQRLVRDVRSSGRPGTELHEHGHPSRWLQASAVPLEPGGRVLLVLRDVTEARRVEAMRRDFAADASHELKTPIAAIQAAIETTVGTIGRDPVAAKRFAQQAHDHAIRLSRIVADLLDLSRLEASGVTMQRVELDDLVQKKVALQARAFKAAGIWLSVWTEPATVQGSSEDLSLAVSNLLDNARWYTPSEGSVDVAVRTDDREVIVEVRDTGAGIPTRDLPRIFERFYRVDVGRSRLTGGTGLGLAIVKHVVEQHGGSVEVESELTVGSTFRIRLPTYEPGV